jgi:hypothetical protein
MRNRKSSFGVKNEAKIGVMKHAKFIMCDGL